MSAAAKLAPAPKLTRAQALRIINNMPYLVASSRDQLLPEVWWGSGKKSRRPDIEQFPIITVEFEVWSGSSSYTFKPQPFRVMRQISRAEYMKVCPNGRPDRFCYMIHTD